MILVICATPVRSHYDGLIILLTREIEPWATATRLRHKIDGSGVPYLIPDLAGSAAVASREPTTVVQVILHGAASVATRDEPTGPQMPSYAWQLTDAQVAAVATYVRNSWGHSAGAVSESAVRTARKSGQSSD